LDEKEAGCVRKELLIRKRSNLAAMKLGPTLLLFQVKFPFEGGINQVQSIELNHPSSHEIGHEQWIPLFFLLDVLVILKSPANIRFGRGSTDARFKREFQQSTFSQ
jgi:hypothetical protein